MLTPTLGAGIIGIGIASGLGTDPGSIHGTILGMEGIGTIPGTGTIRIGGITAIIRDIPVAAKAIVLPHKDLRNGIRATRLLASVPEQTGTIGLATTKADALPETTVLRVIRPSVRKATIAVLREIRRHLPARGPLRVPDSNPAPDPLPAGTEAIRPLRPTASVRVTKIYAGDHPLPIGEVRRRVRKTG